MVAIARHFSPKLYSLNAFLSRMYHLMLRLLFSILLLLAFCQLDANREASATIVVSLSFEELIRQADLIVLGRCEDTLSAWDTERKKIFTYITIVPERCLKGSECPLRIYIRQLGGVVDNLAMTITGSPSFSPNERVVLFLRRSNTPYYQVLGMSQGKFSVIQRAPVEKPYVKRDLKHLTFLKKRNGEFHLKDQNGPEQEIDLETFIKEIESLIGTQ